MFFSPNFFLLWMKFCDLIPLRSRECQRGAAVINVDDVDDDDDAVAGAPPFDPRNPFSNIKRNLGRYHRQIMMKTKTMNATSFIERNSSKRQSNCLTRFGYLVGSSNPVQEVCF